MQHIIHLMSDSLIIQVAETELCIIEQVIKYSQLFNQEVVLRHKSYQPLDLIGVIVYVDAVDQHLARVGPVGAVKDAQKG